MSELDDLLGIDPQDPEQRLADDLTSADYEWMDQLVALRKRRNITQAQVAERMGLASQSVVSDIENLNTDPKLSTLRRYALAVGATVRHVARLAEVQVRVVSSPPSIEEPSRADTTGNAIRLHSSAIAGERSGLLAGAR